MHLSNFFYPIPQTAPAPIALRRRIFLLQRSLRRPTEILVRQPVYSYPAFHDTENETQIITFTWCCFLGKRLDEPLVMFGDIAVNTGFMNADPCTAHTCKWPKSSNGKVYVPYVISNQYCKYFSSLK